MAGIVGTLLLWGLSNIFSNNAMIQATNTINSQKAIDKKESLDHLRTMRQVGGGFMLERVSNDISTPADKIAYIESIYALNAFMETLSSGDNSVVKIQSHRVRFEFSHLSHPFEVVPVIAIAGPTAAFGNGSTETFAPLLIADEWITGEHLAIIGPIIHSRQFIDNGNLRHTAAAVLDLTKFSKVFADKQSEIELREHSELQYKLGLIIYSYPDDSNVTVNALQLMNYNVVPRSTLRI
jgi:hypothetical protein